MKLHLRMGNFEAVGEKGGHWRSTAVATCQESVEGPSCIGRRLERSTGLTFMASLCHRWMSYQNAPFAKGLLLPSNDSHQ